LHRRVCSDPADPDHIGLQEARTAIARNWMEAFKRYVCGRTPALTVQMRAHCQARP
jgi:hypothetical protein